MKRDANAAAVLAGRLVPDVVRRRLEREGISTRGGAPTCLRRLRGKYDVDLLGFLNGATVHELRALAAAVELPVEATAGALRQRLWIWGAALERKAIGHDVGDVQLNPVLSGGRLAVRRARACAEAPLPVAREARFPTVDSLPRGVPALRELPPVDGEPTSLDELCARAAALVGVRLGPRGRDKGSYGRRISELLGIAASSASAPDWRGEVELKTLAVVRAEGGRWRLKDGPALSMRSVDAREKLGRVLWIVRIDEGEVPGSPILSYYYQELGPELTLAFERSRHLRPKGGAGTTARGWYLRRDFFEACGLLRSLNG